MRWAPSFPRRRDRGVRRAAILLAATAVIAVGGVALGTALAGGNPDASPAGTVRAFLIDAVVDHDGVAACRYLTPGARLHVERTASAYPSCSIPLSSAALRLDGRNIDDEAAVKALHYRVERHGAQARVTVSAGGASQAFGLRRATGGEMREFRAPATHWRIDSGADRLGGGT